MIGAIHVLDDDPSVRDALASILDAEGHRAVCHADPESLFEAFAAGGEPVEAVLIDVNLQGRNGIDLIPEILKRAPSAPVIVMTGQAQISIAVRAMKIGATDFLEKPFDAEVLIAALDSAPKIVPAKKVEPSPHARERLEHLTDRERDVFHQLLVGGTYKEIARSLGVSPRTVETHRARVMEKTGCENLAQLYWLATAAGCAPEFNDND